MTGRDDKIYEEAAALWRALFDDPLPATAEGAVILDRIVGELPEPTHYERLASPHLRASNIAFPKRSQV
jgi:hypothetical protein